MNRLAVIFPGQGAQYVGMGKRLHENFSLVRDVFEEAGDVLGIDLRQLCFDGDIEDLTLTENAQPAILTLGVAAFRVYREELELSPMVMAGHSLGEYTALTCAGAISFADAVRVVRQRGIFMGQAMTGGSGGMAAVKQVHADIVTEVCSHCSGNGGFVGIANFNEPMQTVISGHMTQLKNAARILEEKGAEIVYLNVNVPFHSPVMEPAAQKLEKVLKDCNFKETDIPVISNVEAKPYQNSYQIADKLTRQMTAPVRWADTMSAMLKMGVETVVDTGPKSVVKHLASGNEPGFVCYSLDKEEDKLKLHEHLSFKPLQIIRKALAVAVAEPNRNHDSQAYETGVIQPYRKIKQAYIEMAEKKRFPRSIDVEEAVNMLQSVMDIKGVPFDDQRARYLEVRGNSGGTEIDNQNKA